MESILVLTHADDSGVALSKGSLEAVTAGKELAAKLGAQLAIGVVAKDASAAAGVLATVGAPAVVLVAIGAGAAWVVGSLFDAIFD